MEKKESSCILSLRDMQAVTPAWMAERWDSGGKRPGRSTMAGKIRQHAMRGRQPTLSWVRLRDGAGDVLNLIGLLGQGLAFMFSYEGVAMALLTAASIFLVSRNVLNVTFHVEFAIFSAGCIFPLTFNVSAAFKRRDSALQALSELKSNVVAMYLNFGMFDESGVGLSQREVLPIMRALIADVESCLRGPREEYAGTVYWTGSPASEKFRETAHRVYDDFALLAEELQKQTFSNFGCHNTGPAVTTSTERTWQFLQDMLVAFERVKAIRFSSTSIGLRYFSYALINTACIMLAPFWASYCREESFGSRQSGGLADELGLGPYASSEVWQVEEMGVGYGCTSAYLVGLLFTFIVFTLYRVQKDLDDPFVGVGQDDIRWDAWRSELQALGLHGLVGPEMRSMGQHTTPPSRSSGSTGCDPLR